MSEIIEGNKPGVVLESATTHDAPAWPSGRPLTEPQGHCERSSLSTCYLSVPAGELEDLYDYFVREMHEHEQIAAACTRDHQKHERFKRTGKAAACYDASVRVRLLIERAKERQPTDNNQARNAPESA